MSENCQGAKFEILLDGKTQSCRDTMLTAMGAAKLIQSQNPNSKVAVRDLQTGQTDRIAWDVAALLGVHRAFRIGGAN
jgi:hypothetical protein